MQNETKSMFFIFFPSETGSIFIFFSFRNRKYFLSVFAHSYQSKDSEYLSGFSAFITDGWNISITVSHCCCFRYGSDCVATWRRTPALQLGASSKAGLLYLPDQELYTDLERLEALTTDLSEGLPQVVDLSFTNCKHNEVHLFSLLMT